MLLFLFWVGVLRLIGFDVNIWGAASMALTLYSSAYLAEVWRGAIQSLPDGHWEGAAAKGLRFLPTLRLVILPEAFRVSIAPTVGFLVQIIEGTSLACIIGFSDLTKMHCVKLLGQSLMARDFDRQVAEIQVRIAVLNRYTALGIPVTEPVG